MGKKQQKKPEEPHEETAPLWYITYADMITQITAFFVVMFTMADISGNKVKVVMRAFQGQFGVLPRYNSTVQVFSQPQRIGQTEAFVLRRGPPGRHAAVQQLVEDERVKKVIGGKELFEADTATLRPGGRQLLREEVAPDLRGYRNRIEVRGHTATAQYGPHSRYRDAWELGYQRALTITRFLVDECGIEERRFRIVSCADNEPRDTNLTDKGREENRRVEILMTEDLVPDLGEMDRRPH